MKSWDYIIVGAGSAGALLASRLTEDPDISVLLLEAGPDYRAKDTPKEFVDRTKGLGLALESPRNYLNPEFYWHNTMATRAQGQLPFQYRRGRGLGGSSTINGLYAIRGVPDDFTHWEELGARGWGAATMLEAFCRIETDLDFGDEDFHGNAGPTPVYREPESGWGGVDKAVRDSALATGYVWSPDHNDPASTGVSPMAMNIRNGLRVSTNHAYLEPARDRPNLDIRGDVLIDKVVFEKKAAIGVLDSEGRNFQLSTGGEVILSAGSTFSPAILLRSGIGPAALVAELGLDLRADLPVGQNAQDHAVTFVEVPVRPEAQTCVGNRPTNIAVRYSSGLGEGRTNDMMLLATNHNYWFGRTTAGIAVSLQQPYSRGSMRLNSLDPHDEPSFELNFLSDERDLIRMRDGLERARALIAHEAFDGITTADASSPRSDEEMMATVKDTMHLSCTSRMGSPDDPHAVVDSSCRVIGMTSLRVVDASVMPTVPSANTHLTVLALAEAFITNHVRTRSAAS